MLKLVIAGNLGGLGEIRAFHLSYFQRLQVKGSLIPESSAHILRARLGVSLTVRLFSAPIKT